MKWFIRSLNVTSGYLAHSPVTFSEKLNCIIGARGTCKSTIVETLRFIFNCNPDRIRLLTADTSQMPYESGSPSSRGLISASLREGVAKCTVVGRNSSDDVQVSVERLIGADPRIFRDGVKELNDNELLRAVEIYSQGDLQRMAEEPDRRLQLIDRPYQSTVDHLQSDRQRAAKELRDVGPTIRSTRISIESQLTKVRSLDTYQRDLEALQTQRPQLSAELAAERQAFQDRSSLLERVRSLATKRRSILNELTNLSSGLQPFREAANSLKELTDLEGNHIAGIFNDLAELLDHVRVASNLLQTKDTDEPLKNLQEMLENKNQRYYELRKQEQEVNDTLKREDALKKEIAALAVAQSELAASQDRLQTLLGKRSSLRREIEKQSEELYNLRLNQVNLINKIHGSSVLLSLHQGTQSQKYREMIAKLLEGSRLRNQEDVANELAQKVPPSDLIDIAEAGDAKRLSDALQRDLGQMTRLVSYIMDNPKLYELEGIVFEDRLEITMFVAGEAKPISQLSKGQMATAILPLVLRPAPYPLIFDQPEDDLDNAFIYQDLITRIRELKTDRQLIFVTHNANIPVLGEAEHVIVMSMKSPNEADTPFIADVDGSKYQILKLLEGGAEAFRKRQHSYGNLLEEQGVSQ